MNAFIALAGLLVVVCSNLLMLGLCKVEGQHSRREEVEENRRNYG